MKLIKNKEQFTNTTTEFLELLFAGALENGYGQIELKLIKSGPTISTFHSNYDTLIHEAYEACNNDKNVYFGVNPRVGGAGKKENVQFLTSFHAEVDYGTDGHKKKSEYATYEEAFDAIQEYYLPPTILIHSGGGIHCYWVLHNALVVEKHGVEVLERINKGLSKDLKADAGTHDLGRVLRIPETFNLKLPDNPREVTVISMGGPKYNFEHFAGFIKIEEPVIAKDEIAPKVKTSSVWDEDIKSLNISDKMKNLIKRGNDGTYASRSEAEMAVLLALLHSGYQAAQIKVIFNKYPIGDKYREQQSPERYLDYNINKAKEYSNWTEEEFEDPLFLSGSITKDDKNKYGLNVLKFDNDVRLGNCMGFL